MPLATMWVTSGILLALFLGSTLRSVSGCLHPVSNYSTPDNTSTAVGTRSNYSCSPGFAFPNGQLWTVFTCLANNSWSPAVSSCQLPCSQLTVANATLSFSNTATGVIATATCLPGYRFTDSATAKSTKCVNTNQWTLALPTGCLPVQCPYLGSSGNGSHNTPDTYDRSYPVVVNYTCDTQPEQYYFPDRATWRVTECNRFGDWTQLIPSCVTYGELPVGAIEYVGTQVEAKGALSITTILIGILGTIVGVVLVLDIITFPRQFFFMKKNVHSRFPSCCKGVEQEEEQKTILEDMVSLRSSISKSLSSLRNVKVTPSPSVADMDSIRSGAHEPPKESDPLVNFLATGGNGKGDGADANDEVAPSGPKRRIASARESVRRALEKTAVGKKLVKAINAYKNKFSGSSLPLGSENAGNPIGPPIETINEAYQEEEDSEGDYDDGDSYTDDSEEDENRGGRRSHMKDIDVHEV